MSADLPPTYTQEPSATDVQVSDDSDHSFVSAPDRADGDSDTGAAPPDAAGPQILIIPVTEDAVHFQKGYLGADNERAAIEGELQIKSADAEFRWRKVSVVLRSAEKAHGREIELANTELVLAATPDQGPQQRSSFSFSIPLPLDTPQCLHTSRSSLAYTLTANVWPIDEDAPPLSRSFLVHTRRYTSHTHDLHPTPETWVIEEPSKIEVQLPRTTYKAGEPIPIYFTVPTPTPDLVVEQGLRLRNLRAELVRTVTVKRDEDEDDELSDIEFANPSDTEEPTSPSQKTQPVPSTSRQNPEFAVRQGEHGERKVIALSGASCRMHPSRPLRIRLVLHQPTEAPQPDSPHHHQRVPSDEFFSTESEAECASITQATLLHSVSFRLLVHATFMNMSTHTERVSTLTIPLIILPPSAPLPEVEPSVDAAYHKKHDRPPTRTIRLDDADVPQYEAGPSGAPGAPPPFEEREAPPPFWSAEAEASSSSRPPTFLESEASTSRLPTFLESEREIFVPPAEEPAPPPADFVFHGEGMLFGFHASDQFDGYADVVPQRQFTPPPSLEMATHDANVTGLATMALDEPGTIEALGLALEQQNISLSDEGSMPPPPPPPMDDPSDPPPSIDSAEFRAPGAAHDTPPRAQSPPRGAIPPPLPHDEGESHGHAPPPYGVRDLDDHHEDHERVVHPPPYMDLVHGAR
ncbi:hypothetical protein L227DRAFT_522029 [Lentinus tigrinus ALCF2SS1-6]|uniref:Uncharacterized protein n=1 Tax=Lentinus tigrinus ALCF2SS1-6 TaxID=1328759 RepID=A0A5C2SGW5_9APHY|nr:hypothetical protein L227DRAFT_522029 [Lentinus tigrinus ALCF2SS1-6]